MRVRGRATELAVAVVLAAAGLAAALMRRGPVEVDPLAAAGWALLGPLTLHTTADGPVLVTRVQRTGDQPARGYFALTAPGRLGRRDTVGHAATVAALAPGDSDQLAFVVDPARLRGGHRVELTP